VKTLAKESDVVIVVGSKNSSNSNRLAEVAKNLGIPAYLIDGAEQIDPAWITQNARVGVTAGASAPEILVEGVIARLKDLGAGSVSPLAGIEENVTFPIPKELQG
jgi:4-hydroxy-3-methylbut-2-en-1-yl diphosphate reductase